MTRSFKLLATCFALSIVFASCKKEEEETVVSDTPKEIILPRVQPIPTASEAATSMQMPQQAQQQQTQNNQVIPPPPAPVATKPGMNPPHGQPGHRCDIQVGAPLNSKPAAPAVQPGMATSKQITMPTPTMTSTPSSAPSILNPNSGTTTAPGMNPPHGEAGHKCEVAVGAPLP